MSERERDGETEREVREGGMRTTGMHCKSDTFECMMILQSDSISSTFI